MAIVEREGPKLYLVDDASARWRVHDVQFRGHRHHRVPLGDGRANTRYFIGADVTRKCIGECAATRGRGRASGNSSQSRPMILRVVSGRRIDCGRKPV